MYYELFKIKDGIVQPLTSREAQIKEVKEILVRDRGSDGDSDGRKKLFAYKELGAVYWMADYRSPGRMRGYEGKDLINDAIRNYDLPVDWMPDDVVLSLIDLYKYNNDGGVAAEALTEISSTLNIMVRTIRVIRERLNTKLGSAGLTEADLQGLIALQNELLELATQIPKKIKEIAIAKEMLRQEEDNKEIGRGNKPILSSMVP